MDTRYLVLSKEDQQHSKMNGQQDNVKSREVQTAGIVMPKQRKHESTRHPIGEATEAE